MRSSGVNILKASKLDCTSSLPLAIANLDRLGQHMKYIAAEATELFIGNLHFDAIRIIATGEYRMAQKQILESVNVDPFWIQNMVEALQYKRSKFTEQ